MSAPLEELEARVCAAVDAQRATLLAVSHHLAEHPELAFAEHHSAAFLLRAAAGLGLRGHARAHGLPTAFTAHAGHDGPRVVLLAEYDALPGLGHACGHNVVAAASLGAAAALAPLADLAGGRLTLLGAPAEERGAGKVLLAERGAFHDAVAAMMVHPDAYDTAWPRIVASLHVDVTTYGRAAHASLAPELGVNALDALALGYLATALLRPHLRPGERLNGVLRTGGTAPNIIPDRATAAYLLRADTTAALPALLARTRRCFDGAAAAVGARSRVRPTGRVYAELHTNAALARAYERNARRLGRPCSPPGALPPGAVGSTDMGNVSLHLPTIMPKLRIGDGRDHPHSRDFAAAAAGADGDRAVLDGAKALALTTLDVWVRPDLRAAVRAGYGGGRGDRGWLPGDRDPTTAPGPRTAVSAARLRHVTADGS